MAMRVISCLLLLMLAGCKLGGSATGIDQDIELQDTISQQTLTLSQDGAFAFKQSYAAGARYNVIVSNASHCNVQNGSGTFGRSPITNLLVSCEPDGTLCTADYNPVCAKAKANIACVTTPCADHAYKTFSNACNATVAKAAISFDGNCDTLEDAVSFDDAPVQMVEALQADPDSRPFTLKASRIDGDVAYLTLQYKGGCGDHDFHLQVARDLVAGQPVVANTGILHFSKDACDSTITREISFDLLPVKAFFQRQFHQTTGRVAIQNVGNYSF